MSDKRQSIDLNTKYKVFTWLWKGCWKQNMKNLDLINDRAFKCQFNQLKQSKITDYSNNM